MNKLDRVEQHSIGDGHNHGPQLASIDNQSSMNDWKAMQPQTTAKRLLPNLQIIDNKQCC